MTETYRRGLVAGSMIAISFGTVFVIVNSGGLPAPWPVVIRVAGAVTAIALVAGLVLTMRSQPARPDSEAEPGAEGFRNPRYLAIVAAEVVALAGGLYVINGVLDEPDVAVAWIAVVVGVHFFGLAWAWRMPLYHWLGTVMTALGVAGFLAHALGGSAGTVGLIAGVGSGFALYAAVAMALHGARQDRAVAAA